MKPKANSMNATPGLIGAAVVGSAAAKGTRKSEAFLTKTVPVALTQNTAFESIRLFHGYVGFMIVMIAAGYWIINGMSNNTLPTWMAETSPVWVIPVMFMFPTVMLVMGLPITRDHISAKMRARVYTPTDDLWNRSGETLPGALGLLVGLIQIALYTAIMVPAFLIQDTIEALRVLLTGGKHRFRTSEARYFEQQKRHYNVILANLGKEKAEKFLMDSSMGMHTARDTRLTLPTWLNAGYRQRIIGNLERKYGAITPGSNVNQSAVARSAAQTPNKGVLRDAESIVVKPVKPLN